MRKSNFIYFYILFLQAVACKNIPAYSPDNKYTIKVLSKKKSTGKSSVFGYTDELYPDGSYRPVILAYISADNQGTKSNNNGRYSLNVIPGKHNISVRSIGYQPVLIKGVRIGQNDSVRIDFHLVADTTKL
jgi:hypothetical protein